MFHDRRGSGRCARFAFQLANCVAGNALGRQLSDDNQKLREALRRYLAENKLSRAQFAQSIKYSPSTLDKFLSGAYVSKSLALKLQSILALGPVAFNFDLPFLHKEEVTHLEGFYQTIRPSFRSKTGINTFCTEIMWSQNSGTLTFVEHGNTLSPSNKGIVSMPRLSTSFFLLSCTDGRFRLAILQDAYEKGVFYGGLFTHASEKMGERIPTATSIVLMKLQPDEICLNGVIEADHIKYADFAKKLAFAKDEKFIQVLL